jgi:hypothetical protein
VDELALYGICFSNGVENALFIIKPLLKINGAGAPIWDSLVELATSETGDIKFVVISSFPSNKSYEENG